jgi:hypothetical protein
MFLRATLTAAALITAVVLLAISGVAAGGAQAAPFEPGLPLSPASQQNAVRAAKNYLDYTAFSRQRLIKQLEYDHYSEEDATFAVDSITVDWNEQAAKKAKDYLGYTSFSHDGLVNQLTYDGLTSVQAEYGVAAAGL